MRINSYIVVGFGMTVAASVISAQPAFEVASIRPNTSGDTRMMGMQYLPGGKLIAKNYPLFLIIANAYHISFQSVRLSGGPDWVHTARYDIDAAAAQGAIPAGASAQLLNDKMSLMLQSLLADRFKLTLLREVKEIPVYAIVVSKSGPRLQQATIVEKDCVDKPGPGDVSCHSPSGGQGRGVHAQAISMADLAHFVENWTDRPLLDQTGIQGLFKIDTGGWQPLLPRPGADPASDEAKALADPSRPTLFDVFEQLGLKLESKKAPIETFVIEYVEKPSQN
jgi:uncharacterized protein (TIGR03435 family)